MAKHKKNSPKLQAQIERATSLGSIELVNFLGFAYRSQPRELQKIRKKYISHCVWLYRQLEQVGR